MGKLRPGDSVSETKAGAEPGVTLFRPPAQLSLEAPTTRCGAGGVRSTGRMGEAGGGIPGVGPGARLAPRRTAPRLRILSAGSWPASGFGAHGFSPLPRLPVTALLSKLAFAGLPRRPASRTLNGRLQWQRDRGPAAGTGTLRRAGAVPGSRPGAPGPAAPLWVPPGS